PNWNFSRSIISGVSQNAGRTDMSFDIVAESATGRCCAIEVSFQVTTNSTIERKAGQAADRQRLLHKYNHRIAYVLDGAGNFQRRSALTTICAHSDCTVTFRDAELDKLVDYLKTFG
ncbi:MAG: restriction endonuclease, partial [Terriglobia bacterium]